MGKKDWENTDQKLKEIIQAYVVGVNAYIQIGKMPVEFTLLRHKPEKWTANDTPCQTAFEPGNPYDVTTYLLSEDNSDISEDETVEEDNTDREEY